MENEKQKETKNEYSLENRALKDFLKEEDLGTVHGERKVTKNKEQRLKRTW